jgi:hypothetical protein
MHGSRRQGDSISTYFHILQTVLLANTSQDILFAALLHLTRQEELVEDEIGFLEIEDDVELADVAVVLVHLLDISMDNLQCD